MKSIIITLLFISLLLDAVPWIMLILGIKPYGMSFDWDKFFKNFPIFCIGYGILYLIIKT